MTGLKEGITKVKEETSEKKKPCSFIMHRPELKSQDLFIMLQFKCAT